MEVVDASRGTVCALDCIQAAADWAASDTWGTLSSVAPGIVTSSASLGGSNGAALNTVNSTAVGGGVGDPATDVTGGSARARRKQREKEEAERELTEEEELQETLWVQQATGEACRYVCTVKSICTRGCAS